MAKSLTLKQIETIKTELAQMALTPKRLTIEAAIAELADEISAALSMGYTYADIQALLKRRGVETTPATIRKYHRKHLSDRVKSAQQ